MPQLLVRKIDESLVRKLKRRAASHGVSVEEEHRQILKHVLSNPVKGKPALIEFLLSENAAVHPDTELETQRSRKIERHRDVKL